MGRPKNLETERFSVNFPKEWWAIITKAAASADQSIGAYLRTATRQRLEREGYTLPEVEVASPGRPKGEAEGDEEKVKRPRGRPRKPT